MKTLEKFKSQALSKEEMGQVKGGEVCLTCSISIGGVSGGSGKACGSSLDNIAMNILQTYGPFDDVSVSCRA